MAQEILWVQIQCDLERQKHNLREAGRGEATMAILDQCVVGILWLAFQALILGY